MMITILLVRRKLSKELGYAMKFRDNSYLLVFHENDTEPEVLTTKLFKDNYEEIFLKSELNIIEWFKKIFKPALD